MEKLKFIELMDEMKNIQRAIFLKSGKQETNAEHSFHLAMMVIAFSDDFPQLNVEKCLKLALIHDIVEIYAWDTIVLDEKMTKTKIEREMKALEKLTDEYITILPGFILLLNEYEDRKSKESQFVYSLDKIQPIIQVVMEWWKTWHNWKIDFDKIKKRQYSKMFNEFWLDKILDIYFKKAETENMFYKDEV